MKIVLTGGGSGGHITPILAVARELKQLQPELQLIYVGQRGDQLSDVPAASPYIDKVYTVRAGKFRRYHGEGFKQIFDLPTLAKNIRDAMWVLVGILQSYRLLKKLKPAIIFTRGGFVSVPVAIGGRLCRIPYITHDSDAIPSLANRIIARRAMLHAVALPKEVYAYPQGKTVTVGVPIQSEFHPVNAVQKKVYKQQIGLEKADKILFITGGGNGALSLNNAAAEVVPALLETYPDLAVVHVAGRLHEAALTQKYDELLTAEQRGRVIVKGFVTELYAYSGAADVIIMRAGATNLAEFAAQQKACIVVPNPLLTGGHQLKNVQALVERHAALCITEQDLAAGPEILQRAIKRLLDNPKERQALAAQFGKLAHPNAARELAVLLLREANIKTKS